MQQSGWGDRSQIITSQLTVIEISPCPEKDPQTLGEWGGALQSGKKNRFGALDELLFVFKPKKDFEIQEEVSHSQKEGGLFSILLA